MCGEIEEESRFQADLYQRFAVHARRLLARSPATPGSMNGYLDTLFADVLRRCVQDADDGAGVDDYGRMSMQSLVLARLAGFLAGHVALGEDPLRKLIEAMMLGYSEAESPLRTDGHGHGHSHSHDHGHVHPHEHHH